MEKVKIATKSRRNYKLKKTGAFVSRRQKFVFGGIGKGR
jgi:hypothetical protein